jgi:hypothetical protein
VNLHDFKHCVSAYMQRDATVFDNEGTNLITQAANMARRWAERNHNFEACKTTSQIASVHYQNGALLSAMTLRGTVTPVAVKSLEKAFLPFTDGNGEFPIDVISREKHIQRLQRHYDMMRTTDPKETAPNSTVSSFAVVRHGDMIYVNPADSAALGNTVIPVYFDIVRWLPEYTLDADHDFFLDYCADFMLLRTVYMLNFMIKEDARMPVNITLMKEAWDSILVCDNNIILNASEDASLD